MSNYNNIKIPVGLATEVLKCKTSRKAIDTYFMLKSIAPNGWILNSVKSLTALEPTLKICYKTIKTRIKLLAKLDLVQIHNNHINLASYTELSNKYKTHNGYFIIKSELLEKVKLEDYLIAIAIKEKKQECSNAFYYKHLRLGLNNDIIKGVFNGEKPKGSYKAAVTKAHLNDFIENANTSDFSYAFNTARADVEIGYKKLSKMLGYKGRGSLAYTKRKLEKSGIISIYKREVSLSTKTHSTKNNRATVLGTINFDARSKTLNLRLPDQITINNQTQIIKNGNTQPASF